MWTRDTFQIITYRYISYHEAVSRRSDLHELDEALRQVSRAVNRAARRQARSEPLTEAQVEVLRTIVRNPGTAPGELAATIEMRPSNVSATLRHLTERGLVRRETDPADRRCVRLLPTDKALADARTIDAARTQLVLDAVATLDTHEVERLIAAIPALHALATALRARDPHDY